MSKKKFIAIALVMVMGMLLNAFPAKTFAAGNVPEADETYYDDNDWEGTLVIAENKTIKLSGITHNNDGTGYGSPIKITNKATVNLVIEGKVTLSGNALAISAGIEVEEGSTVNIYGIDGSELTVTGGKKGAGIGGIGYDTVSEDNPKAGNVYIYSGTIQATGGEKGAGIGSGYHSSASDIVIYDGKITANGGSDGGSGIGSGYGTSGGAYNAAKVGYYNGGNIRIHGGTIVANGGYFSAGIGGGYGASSGDIIIDGNANVTATGELGGAGIGTGRGTNKPQNYSSNAQMNITIGGNAVVTASATKDSRLTQSDKSHGGAAIGLGRGWNACGVITIKENASVKASSEAYAAAIGGGWSVRQIISEDDPDEAIARPMINIARTAKVEATNDGSVPAVNGENMFSNSRNVTFKVVNGFWKDGTADDITVKAEGYENRDGYENSDYNVRLKDEQIPSVGEKPADTFTAGRWDITPNSETAITEDTFYTYSYVKETKKDSEKGSEYDYKNEWVDHQWYDSNGNATYKYKGYWKKNSTGWWFEDEKGWYPQDQWQKIDGKWYFFDTIGYMAQNEYAGSWGSYSEGNWWVGDDGAWDGSEPGVWRLSTNGKWWFKDSTGWYAKSKWYKIRGTWYYFDDEGWWDESKTE